MMNEIKTINLYNHNRKVYKSVDEAFRNGEKVVGIVHATGAGKSYIALQLLYDNLFSNSLFLVPNNSIKEHILNIIDKEGLSLENDFPNLTFMTYSKLCYMSDEEIQALDLDFIVLDEFHHIGAPVWGGKIGKLIETHPDACIFGMTAYTVRDRNTAYERDMALKDGDELFSNHIVSYYDLADAMIDEVLPIPIYKTSRIRLKEMFYELEQKAQELNEEHSFKEEVLKELESIRKEVLLTDEYQELIKRQTSKDGKYIYFCNPGTLGNGVSAIEFEMNIAKKEFMRSHHLNEDDCVFYMSTSSMEDEGVKSRDCFYHDVDMKGRPVQNKLRVMFCVNQYNEGVHAPGVDGVILGRYTKSDIVYYEQIGRALNVSDDILEKFKEYSRMGLDKLIMIAKKKGISTLGLRKDEIIHLLISPVIIDLSDNVSFFKDLETNVKNKVRERVLRKEKVSDRILKIANHSFDIDILHEDLYEILLRLKDKMVTLSFDEKIEEAYEYFNEFKTLPRSKDSVVKFSDGVLMGAWFHAFKNRLKDEAIGGNLKAQVLYNYKWPDKLGETYEYFKQYGQLPTSHDKVVLFSNGSSMGAWIARNKDYLETLKLQGDERAQEIYDFKWHEIDKIEEAYRYYLKNKKLPSNSNKTVKFSDGVLMGPWLYLNQSYIKHVSFSNLHAKVIYDARFPKKIDKIGEAYEYYLENGSLPVNSDTTIKFSDGVLMGPWFFNNKDSIVAMSEYGDEKAKVLVSVKWPEKVDKLKETYEYILKTGNIPTQDDKKIKFSDGGLIGAWIYRHKRKIEKLAKTDEIARYVYIKVWPKKIDKIHETYLYLLEHHNLPVGNDKEVLFSDYSLMGSWINDNKKKLIEIAKKGNKEAQLIVSIRYVARKAHLLPKYGLNTPKFRNQLEHVNVYLIEAKCKFILSIGESIIDGLGNLHKCFFMSEEYFISKYGISYMKLFEKYLLLDEFRKLGEEDVSKRLS